MVGLGMTSSFRLMGNWDARCWIHQATFSRWLRPRASTTLDCTGATSSLAWSEPNGAPTIGSPSAGWPPYHRLHSVLHAGWLASYLGSLAPGLVSRRHMFW